MLGILLDKFIKPAVHLSTHNSRLIYAPNKGEIPIKLVFVKMKRTK